MNFFQKTGPLALGSRLRQMSERLTQEATKVYALYGVATEPRWFPVVYALTQQDSQSVAQLAETIGQSQASVSQVIKEMNQRGFVTISKSADDGRKTIITLTDQARQQLPALQHQLTDVGNAVDDMLTQTQHNIWMALDELDYLLAQQSLFERVNEHRKQRERGQVAIVPYTEQYHDAFRQLNQEWITNYFVMEEADYKALNHPDEKILQPGGAILMALYQGEPVGTCALIKMDDVSYEMAKMAVSPKAQGKHVGWLLGQAALDKARALGAKRVYLESNTMLKPAINLYHKLGFQRIVGAVSPYQRANIQMELML
ncbi:bifunctional helix-turn-helix transcriptional regulator/GNAT family N-acetyltransferase [Spirosoma sp. KUDC1026]|uniref:bifunctional helix-turn-helix transcriptional regulator/GNAT family N-acetyltransferase n=1 Tax=Spirosoma sp. KUDC1026 TaxID=2745947 RepID=UPI00159B9F24|nr:bifunctional helix-turn-helix transcriptional regulator/GNAT family N-acetyltransferase [Spirosoma sp. KUDC1026]QKZ14281.1 bifunctional helix-turn-helix transcriptional regulator/GNAT family N-acetyltransferase [Spirosoma sp. KUDC1026]